MSPGRGRRLSLRVTRTRGTLRSRARARIKFPKQPRWVGDRHGDRRGDCGQRASAASRWATTIAPRVPSRGRLGPRWARACSHGVPPPAGRPALFPGSLRGERTPPCTARLGAESARSKRGLHRPAPVSESHLLSRVRCISLGLAEGATLGWGAKNVLESAVLGAAVLSRCRVVPIVCPAWELRLPARTRRRRGCWLRLLARLRWDDLDETGSQAK